MLKEGQRLWYIHKQNKTVKWVAVERVMPDGFEILFDGKVHKLSYDAIGTRLFDSPLRLPVPKVTVKRSSPPKIDARPAYKLQYVREKPAQKPVLPCETAVTVSVPEPKRTPACSICALRKNGTCGSPSDRLCEDYRPTQHISDTERDSFPRYGDATLFRRRSKKK